MELSVYATDLLRALTDPAGAADPLSRQPVDGHRLSDWDLGALLPAVHQVDRYGGHSTLRYTLEEVLRQRQARFTSQTCGQLLDALAARAHRGLGHPGVAVNALLHCAEPWPANTKKACGSLVWSYAFGSYPVDAVMALASVAGPLTGKIGERLYRRTLAPIAKDELAALTRAGSHALLYVAELGGQWSYDLPPASPAFWQRLADIPGYHQFALQALRAAADRAARIHSGELPFVADKAFVHDEVASLGRAARVLMLRDEPGLTDLLDPLLLHVSVAPTAAKTLPSQALLYEIARAAVDFPTPEALATLRAARAQVRHKGVPKQLDRKLRLIEQALADRPDVATRLPDLGFDREGDLMIEVGGHVAVLRAAHDVTLTWRTPEGKESATMPAAVRRDNADAAAEVKAKHKQARGYLGALSRAMEASLQSSPAQPIGRWRGELAATGLGWAVARRLIWQIETAPSTWRAVLPEEDFFTDVDGAVLAPEPDAAIRLWHPMRSSADEIRAWRDHLLARDLRQPFKQAFREIYLLTPAEERTENVSHRFAAHIVRHKQLYALLKGRGWATKMLGPWDGGDFAEATRTLDGGAWRVLLAHEHAAEQDDLAITGQVRFEQRVDGGYREVRLAAVPPLIFSEAMRDIDLFIAVTSIATDPGWTQQGGAHQEYWRETGFGELSETAQTRRDALERILGRLAIAGRCTLRDRWLVVRGELRTYKIHLGSANILMEPDDSYLCIVAAVKQPGDRLYLPFEDDRLGLILSKAFLLAADDRITDDSILRQLRAAAPA